MRKAKKSPEIKYGIEITKPWNSEMYDHNEKVAEEMKANLLHHWKLLIDKCIDDDKFFMDRDWDENEIKDTSSKGYNCPELVKLQRGVCFSGYGDGYSVQMVNDEFKRELDTMANWQLHEEYAYLCFEDLVPRTRFMFVGFGWSKHDYDGRIVSNQEMTSPVLEK